MMKSRNTIGQQRFRGVLKEWGLLAAMLIVLHVGYFGGWIILDSLRSRSFAPYGVLSVLYLVFLAMIGMIFLRRVGRAADPLEYREARTQGLPATAKVLEIEKTGWTRGRQPSGGAYVITFRPFSIRPRRTRREYQMRLRVSRPGEADYEAQVAEYLLSEQVPKKGASIPVKVHPQHPEVVVLSLDETETSRS